MLRALATICALQVCFSSVWGTQSTSLSVSRPRGFVAALEDPEVSSIVLEHDIMVPPEAWPPYTVVITRNLTVTSRDARHPCLLDFGKERHMIQMAPGVNLTLVGMWFAGTSLGHHIDIFADSPESVVTMHDGRFLANVCPDPKRMVKLMENQPRPASLPGHQQTRVRWWPTCFRSRCFIYSAYMDDYAFDRSSITVVRSTSVAPYTGHITKPWLWVCHRVFSLNCIGQKGYDACREEAMELFLASHHQVVDKHLLQGMVGMAGAVCMVLLASSAYAIRYWLLSSKESVQASSMLESIELVAHIGSGSFGSVYKALWKDQVPVAVKAIEYDQENAETVTREVVMSLRLEHPNVIRTLHYLTVAVREFSKARPACTGLILAPDKPRSGPQRMTWIIQELCDRGALTDNLSFWEKATGKDEQAWDYSRLLRYARDIASGMVYLHSLGICHGDLKPANVLLMSDSSNVLDGVVLKVADFGLSRMLEKDKSYLDTQTIGTITHMAPEVLTSGKLRRECDVYSFGCILWEMAAGETLYCGMNTIQVIRQVVDGMRPPFPAHIPKDLVSLVEECWAQDDLARPTFEELVVRLQGMIQRSRRFEALLARRRRSMELRRNSVPATGRPTPVRGSALGASTETTPTDVWDSNSSGVQDRSSGFPSRE